MRRSLAILLFLSALSWMTPSAFGQYPYPYAPPVYGPMPVQYAPPMYGPMPVQYAPPMYGPMPPPYGPPMMPSAAYYPPAPVWQPAPPPRPNVFVYGPLTDPETVPARPAAAKSAAAPVKPAPSPASAKAPTVLPKMENTKNAKGGLTQVQATAPARTLPEHGAIRKTQMALPEGCGSAGCHDFPEYGPCDPIYGCLPARDNNRPMRGHGHFIGEVGAYFLVPYSTARLAFTTTNGGNAGTVEFPRTVDFGPHVSFGYLFHGGWGFRANYWYLRGSGNQSASNADPNTTIDSAMGPPFQINSPSLTLQQGIGVDQFNFAQRLEINVADGEFLKEIQWLDTTFLLGVGARYARIIQTYSASRSNPGGSNGAQTVNVDREDVDAGSRFEGWGPTVSLDLVYALGQSNVSIYGNMRGSFLWGVDRFSQSFGAQRNSVTGAGVPTFLDVTNNSFASDNRVVSIGETELGLQYGCRFGRSYVYSRVGAVYQRWWDVGTPTSASGNLSFLGGTARFGITY